MAVGKKLLSVFFSFTLVMGLLPYSAFADPSDSSSNSTESSSDTSTSNESEFADGGVASKPDPSDSKGGMDSSGSVSGGEDAEFGVDDEFANEQEMSAPDYSDGKLAIWADGLDDPSDVTDVYPPDTNEIEAYANASNLQPMTFSSEMLYFCKYESSCNYDQGLSSGDGYHAMGYFQFDNRYGLGSFLKAAYNYSPSTYSALKVIGDRYGWNVTGATRSNGAFTQLGNDLNTAWHAAYKANPTEFSNLQNGWAYIDSYNGSLGARGCLKAFGINLDNRPDCIKGLCWGMVNLFGAGGGASYINNGNYYGANWFFKNSGINDSMSDEVFVTTLCDYVVNNVAKRYPKQSIYWTGWQNRYKSEKADCLKYLQASNHIAPSPKNVKAAASGSGEVTLSWDPVDGADAYAVAEYVGGSYRTFTTSCAATSYTVGDLSNGKEHGFLVQARVGGKWSAASADLLAYATPQGATKPEPRAEPGNGSVKLSWDKVPGASAYAIASRNADGSYKTYTLSCTATSYTVAGLVNGRSYDLLVQARVDGAWTSFGSSDLVSAIPCDPSSPKNVKAAASGSGEVTLSWDPVDGADAYAVAEYVGGSYRTFTTSCAATSYTVGDLSNGKEHGFLVQARVGGKWSAASADLLAYATPQGATKPEPRAEPGNGSVKLSWDKVPGATKYAVTRGDITTAVYADGNSYEAKGLKNGKTYAFHVRALIDGAWTSLMDDAVYATPSDPSSPKVSASLDGGTVILEWDKISGADKYAIALKANSGYRTYTYDCNQTQFEVKNLNPGVYTFLVQSHSNNGWSSFGDSDLVSVTVPDASSPKATVDYRDGDSVVLSWNPVSGATKYAVAECKNGSFSNFTTESTGTEFEIKNLGFGVKHRYLVQAYVNGSWSRFTENDYVEAFVADKNSPNVKADASGDGQVTLSWEKVSGASKYAIAEYAGGGYRTFTTSCIDSSYVVNDLGNGHEHRFLVQAFVNGGWSAASTDLLVSATPHGVMAPVATAKAGDLSATIQWGKVPGATRYAVAAQNGDGSFTTYTYSCTGLSYTVKGLVSGRTYKMLVQAYVDGKWSSFSSVDLVSVKPYGTNIPTGQQTMVNIANNSGFTSNTSYLILVNRSRHEVGVFRGGYKNWSCIKFWSCVTGAPSTPTITGEYKTTGFKRTNLTTDARARWCTQINGGYFFHSILASNNELGGSWSHGCIRLAVENAKWIYDNIMQGTKVYIY